MKKGGKKRNTLLKSKRLAFRESQNRIEKHEESDKMKANRGDFDGFLRFDLGF